MDKIRTTINLTPEQRKKIETHYIQLLKNGKSYSYSRLIGDAIDYYYDNHTGTERTVNTK